VTRKGIGLPVGSAAINRTPRQTIEAAVREVIGPSRGAEVEIFAPEGEARAQKTYNSRLGILGGISIIGTTGIVTPMSEESWKRSLSLELEIKREAGLERVVLVPGNHGERFVREQMGLASDIVVTMSNFVGYMIEEAVRLGYRQIVLIGHPGKLVKIAAGIFHTHSHIADARMETLVAHLALLGAPHELLLKVSECDTTEAAMEHIDAAGFGHLYNHLALRICQRVMQNLRFTKNPPSATPSCSPLITKSSARIAHSGRLWRICNANRCRHGACLSDLNDPHGAGGRRAGRYPGGRKRHLEQFPDFTGERRALDADIPGLIRWIAQRMHQRVVVLASGDPLFYGIGKRLVAEFGIEQVRIIPGISAVQYLCAKTGIDMNDIWLTSSHGRDVDFDALVRSPKTAMVTDARCGPGKLPQPWWRAVRGALAGDWRKSGDEQRTHSLAAARDVHAQYEMNVVVILNER
jgi:cobalamin biosynthesis protein CbiD